MAIGKRVQNGEVINFTAAAALSGGDVLAFGTRGGVVVKDTASGDLAALQIEGVFEFTGLTADTIAFGDALYYDTAASVVTVTVGSNILLGKATTEKAGAVAGTVNVKLEG